VLPAERRRHQHALFVDEFDHLRRGHVRVLGQHLEQRHEEHVVDDAALLAASSRSIWMSPVGSVCTSGLPSE
jgi:hypothetical protein